ncbi:hypothetical protein RB195_024666 [Necator americanus]|uniref:MULE transposase domain-containing protein n=1 Tax=Necator americanus TaxID=51031 RepID=A0ABR1EP48_NECAM
MFTKMLPQHHEQAEQTLAKAIPSNVGVATKHSTAIGLGEALCLVQDRDDIAAAKLIETEDMSGDGFLLAFVSTNGKKYLERYGHRGIVFDNTFNECFKELDPQYVMTDDKYVFYNAFKAVFPASRAAKVLCSFHISQALQRKNKELLKVKSLPASTSHIVFSKCYESFPRKRHVRCTNGETPDLFTSHRDGPESVRKQVFCLHDLVSIKGSIRNAAITKESDKVWNVVSSCRNGVAYEVTINDSPCDCSEEVAVCSDQCGIAWMPVKLRRQMRAVALL